MSPKIITILVILALVGIFVLQNAETVVIRLFFWEISTSRALMIFTLFLAGALVGWFGRGTWSRRRR